MPNPPLDTKEIVRLYVEEELSVREIATRLMRSYGQIYGILRTRVVMRPSTGGGPRRSMEYIGVARIMRRRIVSGDWPVGGKLLSQEDLAKTFGVRLQTVREAIADLRQRGYLLTVPRQGTRVRPPEDWESEE